MTLTEPTLWPLEMEDDRPHDECGVVAVYSPGRDAARIAYFALFSLQHRGQESAGIATTDGRSAYLHKQMGLVAQVFSEDNLTPLKGPFAIAHNRYSTTGSSHVRNAQPYMLETIRGHLAVAHNGNLTNALELRYRLLERGVGLSSTSDTEVAIHALAAPPEVWGPAVHQGADHSWEAHIRAFMRVAEGAYCLVIMTRDALYAVRDPYGLRPLCLGTLEGGGTVVASESCALLTVGAEFVREVEPGEIVRIDRHGLTSMQGAPPKRRALCSFEHVYFARPDSTLDGRAIHDIRQAMGRQLAREAPAEADVVVPVPDSSTPAAIGYSAESGIPFIEGLIKNRYIGRTFIQPDDELRKMGVSLKYNALPGNLSGRRVILVDDSIVRGNTSGPLVRMLREAGATEVHLRVSSPPVRHPCFMGVDMASRSQLIAHNLNVEEIRQAVGADSLGYLSIEGMLEAIGERDVRTGETGHAHCTACFSGHYPIPVPGWLFEENRDTLLFETRWGD